MNTFENIMENGAFAPKEQMLHFPKYFQIHDSSKVSKGVITCVALVKAGLVMGPLRPSVCPSATF